MPSLTPQERSGEVSGNAFKDGVIAGGLTFIPAYGAVWLAMKRSPLFLKSTNWQSRTALVIMPSLLMFGLASELKVAHGMRQVAHEEAQNLRATEWAEKQHAENIKVKTLSQIEKDAQLTELYRDSIVKSGVRVVPGDRLGLHHKIMNYMQENPIKVLAFVGIPSVAYIFYGKSGQDHLQFQQKVMHTRVLGQATIVGLILSFMGIKEYMDRSGKFITEADAERRVEEMQNLRVSLMARLEEDRQRHEQLDNEVKEAHDADVVEGHEFHPEAKKKKHKHKKLAEHVESL